MRDLTYEVTIPKNTPASTPHEEALALVKGTLSNVLIAFPNGCNRMVHIQILIGDRVILPINAEMSYAYNDFEFDRDCNVTISDYPYEVIVKGWSPDTRYDHTITLVFQIDDEYDLKARVLKAIFG